MKYLPIIGEYDIINSKVKINILSLVSTKISMKIIPSNCITVNYNDKNLSGCINKTCDTFSSIKLTKNDCTGIVINNIDRNKTYSVSFSDICDILTIRTYDNVQIYAFNCDNHFVYPTDLWDTISHEKKKSYFSYHLGDQIYMDDVFTSTYNKIKYNSLGKTKNVCCNMIKEYAYKEYFYCFSRKKCVLQNTFNIMLGDDHDINDDGGYKSEKLYQEMFNVFKNIYYDVQYSLKIIDTTLPYKISYILQIDNILCLSIDNISLAKPQEYNNEIISILESAKDYDHENILLFLPRIPMVYTKNTISKIIFGNDKYDFDFVQVYDVIKTLIDAGKKINIFCGDAHVCSKIVIGHNGNCMTCVYNVGTINNVAGFDSCNSYSLNEKYTCNVKYLTWQNSYITIKKRDDALFIYHKRYYKFNTMILGGIIIMIYKMYCYIRYNLLLSYLYNMCNIDYFVQLYNKFMGY